MADTEVKTLITVKADTAQAAAEMKKLASATDATTTSLKKQTEQAGLVGGKFNELGKSMVGLQMHDAFTKASKAVSEYTGGIVDLNAAYAGYQVGGVYGAAIGGVGVAAIKSASLLDMFGDKLARVREESAKSIAPLTAYNDYLKDTQSRAIVAAMALFTLSDRFAAGRKIIDLANQQLAGYNSTVSTLTRSLVGLSVSAPDTIAALVRVGLGKDQWSGPIKFKSGGPGERIDTRAPSYAIGPSQADTTYHGLGEAAGGGTGIGAFSSNGRDEFGREANLQIMASDALTKKLTENWKTLSTTLGASGGGPSFMERTFGPASQYDAYTAGASSWGTAIGYVAEKADLAGNGFRALSNAAVAGYNAMVDGTMSFGKAFKKSIADSLKALGGQMLIEALKETAYGIASLATFNYGGAALHFKAAGGFALAATAAGVAAHGLGGGSTASASAPNVGSSGASSSSGQATTQTIIVYGDALAENSPRGQQVLAKKIIQKALGSTAVEAS